MQLTTSGNAERPAISPDGKFVAYIQRDGNATSLWVRQTESGSHVQVVPAQPGVTLLAVTVTPDGRFSLVLVECLGACGYAPMFQVNDDYHENLTIEKIDALLEGMK